MWWCGDKLNRKTAHFLLPSEAQKRGTFKLPNDCPEQHFEQRNLFIVIIIKKKFLFLSRVSEAQAVEQLTVYWKTASSPDFSINTF